jgi:serine/threonine protein kinase
MAKTVSLGPRTELSEDERRRIDAGEHEALADDLVARGRPDLAGWVREQIWDFAGALECYLRADRPLDAVRMALESPQPGALERVVVTLEGLAPQRPEVVRAGAETLERRGRHAESARLAAALTGDPVDRARSLQHAGDRMGAARELADAARVREALDALGPLGENEDDAEAHGLAAALAWDLGDAEASARHAQASLRGGNDTAGVRALLARALGSLGHDLAAQIALQGDPPEPGAAGTIPGRYRVTGILPAHIAGAAYVGIDRVTLQEVEIHLLLAEQPEPGIADPSMERELGRFAASAEAAARLGHPAIRPILRIVPEAGLLVMPRAEGPHFRSLIRPPGMWHTPTRARALVAFLVEGLVVAHQRGLVHGGLLPSHMVCDALGRPLLGPFGTHFLGGLAATHTAALEEIMAVTAPEVRAGDPPSVASDIYAIGALLRALLSGTMTGADEPAATDGDLATTMMNADPARRPDGARMLELLRAPVADVHEIAGAVEPPAPAPGSEAAESTFERAIEITAAESWTDELIDTLCAATSPWLQPILDRDGHTLTLAPWPSGCRTLDEAAVAGEGWRDLAQSALASVPARLRAALDARLRPRSLVATAAGDWMVALDDVLSR